MTYRRIRFGQIGKLKKESGIIEGYLEKNEKQNKVYVSEKGNDKNRIFFKKHFHLAFIL